MPGGAQYLQWVALPEAANEEWLTPAHWPAGTEIEVDREVALVSVVGEAVLAEAELLRRVESILAQASIPVRGTHTGSLSLSLLVPAAQADAALRLLHHELVEAQGTQPR